MVEEFTFESVGPFVVMSCKAVATIFGSIYDILGKNGANALLYNVGYKTGKLYAEDLNKITGLEKLELLDKCVEEDAIAQWGRFEYNVNFNTFEGEVRLYNSFLAKSWMEIDKKNRKYPLCAFISGYITGIIDSVFEEKVIVEEKLCAALGNEFCLFNMRKDILGE